MTIFDLGLGQSRTENHVMNGSNFDVIETVARMVIQVANSQFVIEINYLFGTRTDHHLILLRLSFREPKTEKNSLNLRCVSFDFPFFPSYTVCFVCCRWRLATRMASLRSTVWCLYSMLYALIDKNRHRIRCPFAVLSKIIEKKSRSVDRRRDRYGSEFSFFFFSFDGVQLFDASIIWPFCSFTVTISRCTWYKRPSHLFYYYYPYDHIVRSLLYFTANRLSCNFPCHTEACQFSFYKLAWLNVEYASSGWHLSRTQITKATRITEKNVKRFISVALGHNTNPKTKTFHIFFFSSCPFPSAQTHTAAHVWCCKTHFACSSRCCCISCNCFIKINK